jgi:hypothetical protein
MFPITEAAIRLTSSVFWLAQITVQPIVPAPIPVFNGAQFFSALIAGVLLAFGFQLMLTNLGIAAGISLLGKPSSQSRRGETDNFGNTIRKISVKVGIGTLISVTLSLFFACLFAVRLGLFVSQASGAIVGLTIWATFFSLLVWFSSTKIGSLIGSVVNSATAGFQAIFGTAATAFGAKAANKQVVATAEAAAAAVTRQIGSAIEPINFRTKVEDYLKAVRSPDLDLERIAFDFEQLLDRENFAEISSSDSLPKIDRQTFVNLIGNSNNLSQKDIDRIADKLEASWRKKMQRSSKPQDRTKEFADYLKSATREQLLGKEFSDKLDTLIKQTQSDRSTLSNDNNLNNNNPNNNNPVSNPLTIALNSLVGLVLGRTDLSDFDVDKIVGQIQGIKHHVGEQGDKIATQIGAKTPSHNRLKSYVENYLLNAYPWQMKQENLPREFRELLYDPEGDPEKQFRNLQQLHRNDFVAILKQKDIYTIEKIDAIADLLERIRLEALSIAEIATQQTKATTLSTTIENYLLNTPKESLTQTEIRQKLRSIVEDTDADYQQLSIRFAPFNSSHWQNILARRQDLSDVEIAAIVSEIEFLKERIIRQAEEETQSARIKVEAQWYNLRSYLQNTDKDRLNPPEIERELKQFLDKPEGATLRAREANFDRQALVELLDRRGNFTPEEISLILDEVEKAWFVNPQAPKIVAQTKEKYDEAKLAIADYLRNTGKEELNPEGIQRDLTRLIENPQAGFESIKHRLAAMDRDTLVQLLSQREDLTPEQVNSTIDRVQSTLNDLGRVPQRLARQTQAKVQNFKDVITDYLRSTDKEELNPEGIQRDLRLLLNDPRAGLGSLQERLSHFDRETLVALLSQREDISQEDANRIIEQIIVVRERMFSELQKIQNVVQSTIDRILATLRDYLNRLERPELNYESIKNDLGNLFNDPGASFQALRDRLNQFDRNTLIAILSSRKDISEADANRLVAQIEGTRERILHQAEKMQNEAKLRLEEVKIQTQRQAEETRKAAAVASWWLFSTALISAIASASAGAIGVVRILGNT